MAAPKVLAAVAQLTSVPAVASNLSIVTSLIRRASARGAKIIFLPENSDFLAPDSSASRPLIPGKNEFVDRVKEAANQHDIWVNMCIHEAPAEGGDKRCYNTNLLIDPTGTVNAYRKIHLFDVDLAPLGPTLKESDAIIAGTTLVPPIPNTPVGNLGLQTCFDLRFPLPANKLASPEFSPHPATALTYPSAFTVKTGPPHWETLLRARAIENQCYVFASAQVGEHFPGRVSHGHAMIVDPWGTVVAQCSPFVDPNGSLCYAEIDLDLVAKVRREMPMGR